ncbi:hypothetical protein HanRHA438_Chr03g0113791 [Helianthus annuus]|uniref:Uncharacterized protein n=1 Tax=Helianthus annuus TaxID=4232 RepID=A0A251V5S4_HELAN|nr:uncharacterized protein LOC110928963 isoform X1 [Helianthus annuus]KAF5813790.1 hypothetical protein HanXRQr2_Chr03g0102871 [Helianthus annuus]KAJ0592487.1 hypothetical protein HanHA300_Chr03g0085661 [Helianthus annuus]KAJ0607479.1 hypothetical protein HanHA89_Chr03g0097221 [Helianthus annuus]KAJ0767543.1 hypothetical protein HanLR1_Chr03g0090581 [Helianthus annuus]KAJ0773369.1 hypothetical protein HanOQP8_Chr03g0098491 [Helianthus annuus]
MQSNFPKSLIPTFSLIPKHQHQALCKIVSCANNSSSSPSYSSSSSSENKHGFKQFLGHSLGDIKSRINDFDGSSVQDALNIWVSKTSNFINEVASPLVKNVHDKNPTMGNAYELTDNEEFFMTEQTIDGRTPGGDLSLAAIVSIEQFSRMNGLTGKKMQRIFKALVPSHVSNDARNLVEYCCFRFLSRDSSEIHPSLKEPAFRRLVFVTMLAWEHPYTNEKESRGTNREKASFQVHFSRKLVGEEAFVRIAPAISGLADWPTVHNLFKALSGGQKTISFQVWSKYIDELLKVYEGRKSYHVKGIPHISGERILCLGSSRKRPVLKWENNIAWPGKLTLTDKALYYEAIGLKDKGDVIRMDLTKTSSWVEKTRVGPFGSNLFDSAISVTSSPESKPWVLEFVDFGGEMRRDVWYAFIKEVISLYQFIRDYGPEEGDQSVKHIYGAHTGYSRAVTYAINGIARLQALQFSKKLLEEPTKLVQFSYLQNAPYGEMVCQTLAVNCWGGQLITRFKEIEFDDVRSEVYSSHVYDIDGGVYLRKWMRHSSWNSSVSDAFWKNTSVKQALVLSKNLVVSDKMLVEKAAVMCRQKYAEVEKTQATIDAAMIEGIPSNIDLFKELVLPLTVIAKNFGKLRRWEEPHMTASFLAFVYALTYRNLLSYVFPVTLMVLATSMLVLKGLKEQGRLGRTFGKVTIRDQPPSNTIEKIIAVKEAMRDVEKYMQNINVSLLKVRTILLAGQPQITTEVAMVLLFGSAILLTVPFKYVLSFLILDLFTQELKFRKEMVMKMISFLKARWDTVPASTVSVLPFDSTKTDSESEKKETKDSTKLERTRNK